VRRRGFGGRRIRRKLGIFDRLQDHLFDSRMLAGLITLRGAMEGVYLKI